VASSKEDLMREIDEAIARIGKQSDETDVPATAPTEAESTDSAAEPFESKPIP
jgi:hypothetical protein